MPTADQNRNDSTLGLILFAPGLALRVPMAVAKHDIDSYFDGADSILDTPGRGIADAVGSADPIGQAIAKLVRSSMLSGYQAGANLVGKSVPGSFAKLATQFAAKRGARVQRMMRRTTKRTLKSSPNSDYILSADRAERAVSYEARVHYFKGLLQALSGEGYLKFWLTTGADPCALCLDNEDDGGIDMDDIFSSGDAAPLAHLSCLCILGVRSVLGSD